MDHIKSDFNSGLKSCSLIYQIPSDAQLKSGDTVAFQVLDENGNVLADDNTETQRYTTVSIQYKFEDGSEIPNTAGGTFTVPYGTKLDLTPAKTLYGYEFVKADGLNTRPLFRTERLLHIITKIKTKNTLTLGPIGNTIMMLFIIHQVIIKTARRLVLAPLAVKAKQKRHPIRLFFAAEVMHCRLKAVSPLQHTLPKM